MHASNNANEKDTNCSKKNAEECSSEFPKPKGSAQNSTKNGKPIDWASAWTET
jgi:hypothetical protein